MVKLISGGLGGGMSLVLVVDDKFYFDDPSSSALKKFLVSSLSSRIKVQEVTRNPMDNHLQV